MLGIEGALAGQLRNGLAEGKPQVRRCGCLRMRRTQNWGQTVPLQIELLELEGGHA